METKNRKQKPSKTYTLKSFGSNIIKLEEMKLITKEETKTVLDIRRKAVERFTNEMI